MQPHSRPQWSEIYNHSPTNRLAPKCILQNTTLNLLTNTIWFSPPGATTQPHIPPSSQTICKKQPIPLQELGSGSSRTAAAPPTSHYHVPTKRTIALPIGTQQWVWQPLPRSPPMPPHLYISISIVASKSGLEYKILAGLPAVILRLKTHSVFGHFINLFCLKEAKPLGTIRNHQKNNQEPLEKQLGMIRKTIRNHYGIHYHKGNHKETKMVGSKNVSKPKYKKGENLKILGIILPGHLK